MTLRAAWSNPDPGEWTLWNPVPGEPAYHANFYTPTEPYLRKHVQITHMSLATGAEEKARVGGYVPLNELPKHGIEYWARSDARMVMNSVLRHLAREP